MKRIKCEYCRRGSPAEEFECSRCGAPLPLHEEQLRSSEFLGLTQTTHAEPYYPPTVIVDGRHYVDLPGPFMAYRKDANTLRVERDR
jgi:hypothetical protein